MLPLTIQLANDPIDIPFERMLFGNISPSNTHDTAPIEEAKNATKAINEMSSIQDGRLMPKYDMASKARKNDIPKVPKRSNFRLPTLSMSDLAKSVNTRFVIPMITV